MKRGFTLIELLAVIAVFMLLLSLLIPGLKAARDRAGLVPCMNNLRQLYVLCVTFAGDNNSNLPASQSQNPLLFKARSTRFQELNSFMMSSGYPPQIWYCPSMPYSREMASGWGDPNYKTSGRHSPLDPGPKEAGDQFPIGYFYMGNPDDVNNGRAKYRTPPPLTLGDLTITNCTLAVDFCDAWRPVPNEASQVAEWSIFPHSGPDSPTCSQQILGSGACVKKRLSEMSRGYSYYHPRNVFW